MQPIVAIVADTREFDNEDWHCVPDQYMDALSKVAKVLPIFIPALGDFVDHASLLDRVDGVMLTGSKANVHPSYFGVEPDSRYEPYDLRRDATSLLLVTACIDKGVPLLALCRGIQELNVALGGSLRPLIHEEPDRLDHRAADVLDRDKQFEINQDVTAREGGCIAEILGPEFRTNSLHSQALDHVSPRLQVEATASDGTVEAVSVRDAKSFAIGVQWHPEYWAETDSASRAIFEAFGHAVRAHQGSR
ncbi:gamma-glutamyl-gamma-aminobutyrate hydrolase family protein [uncultured Tateyamaria sp.]|uniref:gamma-glutamyl-gamma-aminobutyrate hydrolase family protein n=1 Tax=uncultured Tateyamaria sp. TaxID=455651 RepID=UPI00261EB9CB|nr:gamma-glutamyl-gamma-aminobutyrate hydrolase family protein [uncultured Tateyamaria sp.]